MRKTDTMATLKDISKKAGVGLSTVSYVINKTGLDKVSPKTQERILSIARELNYQPNISGRALAKGKTFMAGAIFPDITGSFLAEILQGLEDALNEASYSLILCTGRNAAEFNEKCRLLSGKQIDGMAVFQLFREENELLTKLSQRIPIVSVAKTTSVAEIPSVCVDGEAINYLALKYLIGRGHLRIAVQNSSDPARLRGVKRAAKEFPDADLSISDTSSGADFLEWGLSQNVRPTAYVTGGDLIATELIGASLDRGLRIPRDLSVIGVNGDNLGTLIRPRLTTISQPRYEQGYQAGRILLQRIEHRPCESILLQPTLIERETVRTLEDKHGEKNEQEIRHEK